MCISSQVMDEIRRIVKISEIFKEDDGKWPQKNKDGRQELEIKLGNEHISFEVCPGRLTRAPRCRLLVVGWPSLTRATDGENRLLGGRHGVG